MPDREGLFVNPDISRKKFEREVSAYRQLEPEYLKRGWVLYRATFPEVRVLFCVPRIVPRVIAFAVKVDFTNYDLWPPSVRMIDPFSGEILRGRAELLSKGSPLARRRQNNPPPEPVVKPETLMQIHGDDGIPFLCIPGVREYHEHPAHTGDSWFLHRSQGEGTLHHILDMLWRLGSLPVTGIGMEIRIGGLTVEVPPWTS